MLRCAVAWFALACLGLSCFGPWVSVTTFSNAIEYHGAFGEAFYGGTYLLGLAGVAALGLPVRRPALTVICAVLACLLTLLMSYEAPGTMMQFGWMAELAWGAYLAVASSFALAIAASRTSKRPQAAPA